MKPAYGDAAEQMHNSGVGDLSHLLGWIEMDEQTDRQTDRISALTNDTDCTVDCSI